MGGGIASDQLKQTKKKRGGGELATSPQHTFLLQHLLFKEHFQSLLSLYTFRFEIECGPIMRKERAFLSYILQNNRSCFNMVEKKSCSKKGVLQGKRTYFSGTSDC